MQDLVAKLVRPEIRALRAYHVPDAAGLIKLDAMENPYRLAGGAQGPSGWRCCAGVELNRYPDPQGPAVQEALRDGHGHTRRHGARCSATAPTS